MRYSIVLLFLCCLALSSCTTSPKALLERQDLGAISAKYLTESRVVVITHPLCHFSSQAFKDFTPEIRNHFKKALLIAPISSRHFEEESKSVDDWNRTNDLQLIKVLSEKNLPSLDLSSTPQFYFFKNGLVVRKIVGWPKDKSNLSLLTKAFLELRNDDM